MNKLLSIVMLLKTLRIMWLWLWFLLCLGTMMFQLRRRTGAPKCLQQHSGHVDESINVKSLPAVTYSLQNAPFLWEVTAGGETCKMHF